MCENRHQHKNMQKNHFELRLALLLLPFVVTICWGGVSKAITVSSHYPETNAIHVDPIDSVVINFSDPVNPNNFDYLGFRVSGSQTAYYKPDVLEFLDGNKTLIFRHRWVPFQRGETIQVRLSEKALGGGNSYQWSFSILNNKGYSIFEDWMTLGGLGKGPRLLFLANINRDTLTDWTDLVVVCDHEIDFFRNLRETKPPWYPFNEDPDSKINFQEQVQLRAATLGDFDLDGDLDLAVADYSRNEILILANKSGSDLISFSEETTIPVNGGRPIGVTTIDLNRDNFPDLAVINEGDDVLHLFRNDGSFQFSPFSSIKVNYVPHSIVAGDFDNDGDQDLAVACSGADSVFILSNDGAGGFSLKSSIFVENPDILRTGNWNGNKYLDLAVSHTLGRSKELKKVRIFCNNSLSPGEFALCKTFFFQTSLWSFTLADIDSTKPQDLQDLDVIGVGRKGEFYSDLGHGFFGDDFDAPRDIVSADIDKSGAADLAVINGKSIELFWDPACTTRCYTVIPRTLDFDLVPVGEERTKTFCIKTYDYAIWVDSLYLKGDEAFELPDPPTLPFIIEASDSVICDLKFAPDTIGTYTTEVRIHSPTCRTWEHVWAFGEGGAGVLSVRPNSLFFFAHSVGDSDIKTLWVYNKGNMDLPVGMLPPEDTSFSIIDWSDTTISPHDSVWNRIQFKAYNTLPHRDSLLVFCRDFCFGDSKWVSLHGRCNRPPVISPPIPDTTISEGATFPPIPLDDYVDDPDDPDSALNWKVDTLSCSSPSYDESLEAIIGPNRILKVKVPDPNWNGECIFEFTVTDPWGSSDKDTATFIVTSVNDAPWIGISPRDTTIVENELLVVTVSYGDTDCMDSVSLSSSNSPPGAIIDTSRPDTVLFIWRPDFDQGTSPCSTYEAIFKVAELPPGSLSTVDTLGICVKDAIPDLSLSDLKVYPINEDKILVNRKVRYSVKLCNSVAPFEGNFNVDIWMENTKVDLDSFGNMDIDSCLTLSGELVFHKIGSEWVKAEISYPPDTKEGPPDNNTIDTLVTVHPAKLIVNNAFTPNGDGINDYARFNLKDLLWVNPVVRIFDLEGRLLATLDEVSFNQGHPVLSWDGRDSNGRMALPGLYLYIFEDKRAGEHSGTIVLAR